jgi:hypothetical protein
MPASFSTPSISSASVSSGAAATFTHFSAMYVSYPTLFTEARRRVFSEVRALEILGTSHVQSSRKFLSYSANFVR